MHEFHARKSSNKQRSFESNPLNTRTASSARRWGVKKTGPLSQNWKVKFPAEDLDERRTLRIGTLHRLPQRFLPPFLIAPPLPPLPPPLPPLGRGRVRVRVRVRARVRVRVRIRIRVRVRVRVRVRARVRARVRGGRKGWGRAGAARLGLGLKALDEEIGEMLGDIGRYREVKGDIGAPCPWP